MTNHLKNRHLEQAVYPKCKGMRSGDGTEIRCPDCGWICLKHMYEKHRGCEECKSYAWRKQMVELEKIRNRPRTTITLLAADGSRVPLEWVKEFTYLGRVISADDRDEPAVEQRMTAAWRAWHSLKPVFRAKMRRGQKIGLANVIVQASLLYGCEMWCLSKSTNSRLRSAQDAILRLATGLMPIMTPAGLRKPSHKLLLQRAHAQDIVQTIQRRRLQFFGRVFRRTRANPVTDLLHELWDDEGRPTYERSKPSWLKQVRTDIDNSMNFQDVYNQATWESDCLEAGDPYEG